MPMAVERNFGNLAEMYACSIAVADYGIRPALIDSMMVSDVGSALEGWPWIDKIPMHRGCDPTIITQTNPQYPLPTFLHYCQSYHLPNLDTKMGEGSVDVPNFSKYGVPDHILDCPIGSKALEGEGKLDNINNKRKHKASGMHLGSNGLLPEPPVSIDAEGKRDQLRHIFMNCAATRFTNQAALDYRKWFCEVKH